MPTPAKLSTLEKLRQRTASTRIQKNIRQRQHHKKVVQLAQQSWEKLIDHKQAASFYYNRRTGLTQWMKPYLLKKINMELNTTFNYYDTPEYLNQRSKVHQSEKVNINEFKFKASWMSAPELDEAQYSVNQVAPHLLLPPGEVWDPVPKSNQDFGDTGLLTRTTGDTARWICPKCKYTNKPGTLMCEICGAEKPKAMGQKAEDLLHLTNGDNTTLLAASIPWSYPQEEGKKESLYDEEYAPEHEPNAEELLAIDDAQQLLLALDREHASDSDEATIPPTMRGSTIRMLLIRTKALMGILASSTCVGGVCVCVGGVGGVVFDVFDG